MDNAACIDVLHTLARELPVSEWRIADVHVWPIWCELFMESNAPARRSTVASPRKIGAAMGRELQGLGRALWAGVRDWEQRAPLLEPAEVLLVSDGVSFARLDGRWFEKFCDPIAEFAHDHHITHRMWTPLTRALVPRSSPSVLIEPFLSIAPLLAAGRRAVAAPLPRLEAFDEAALRARALASEAKCPSWDELTGRVSRLLAYADAYGWLLAAVQPKVMFIVNYYGYHRCSAVLACRRRAIPSVDLQHGYAGEQHWAYNWPSAPPGGYETLPDFFWCWSEEEQRAISAWADRTHGAHRAFVGGPLFVLTWLNGTARLLSKFDAEILRLRAASSARHHVLYTAQSPDVCDQPRVVRDLAVACGEDVCFWVRLHPSHPNEGPAIEAALRSAGITDYHLKPASEYPLGALLRHMDAHVTAFSSSVAEAALFGVPSIIMQPSATATFEPLIRAGWASVIADPVEAASRLRLGLRRPERRVEPPKVLSLPQIFELVTGGRIQIGAP